MTSPMDTAREALENALQAKYWTVCLCYVHEALSTLNATPPAASEQAPEFEAETPSMEGESAQHASIPLDHQLGYLYLNPDTGVEFAKSHPIDSGEVTDAQEIRPATAPNLLYELGRAWEQIAECRALHVTLHPEAGAPSREAIAAFLKERDEALGPIGPWHATEERLASADAILALSECPAAEEDHSSRAVPLKTISEAWTDDELEPAARALFEDVFPEDTWEDCPGLHEDVFASLRVAISKLPLPACPALPQDVETKEGGAS